MTDTPTPRSAAAEADAYEAAERTPPRPVTTVHLPDPVDTATEPTRHDQEHGIHEEDR